MDNDNIRLFCLFCAAPISALGNYIICEKCFSTFILSRNESGKVSSFVIAGNQSITKQPKDGGEI